MKTFLLLFALMIAGGAAHAETLHYCLIGRYDEKVDADFRKHFYGGWIVFQDLTGRRDPVPELRYSTDQSKIRVYVYPDQAMNIPAGVNYEGRPVGGEIMYVYYNSRFGYSATERKEKILAHELCHFYYRLPDQYDGRSTVDKHDCVMGNFAVWGWSGKFCPECQARVDKYYKK
jgi:hypothetical protein